MRISVTNRCNERCLYCRPRGYTGWAHPDDQLTADEVVRLVRIATGIGFRKFRLTGGEPLVRSDLLRIVGDMAQLTGVSTIGISTNGTRLGDLAFPLREAGARTLNISLDALNPPTYRSITGGDVKPVLRGIDAAIAAGFERVKLNAVLLRGTSEEELWPLTLFASEHRLPLRFIELMPTSPHDRIGDRRILPVAEAMARLGRRDRLIPVTDRRLGHGPAKYYRLEKTGALIGFIGAMTNQHFCDSCNRVRLTADGMIRPCLGRHGEVDLRGALRGSSSDAEIALLMRGAVAQKPRRHAFHDAYAPCRPMVAIGG